MHYTVIVIFIVICFVGLILWLRGRDNRLLKTVSQLHRGTQAERSLILSLLKLGIPAGAIFHDLYIQKSNGEFSQIDLVLATKAGIIVIEVKDFSGWIFGNGGHSQWTQVLAFGQQKYHFYNPIRQNNGHVYQLKRQIKQNVPFYSIIVFYGDCELRDISLVPKGTYIAKPSRVSEIITNIINQGEPAKYSNKQEIVQILSKAVQNGSDAEIRKQHIVNIRGRLGKDRVYE